jgi:hypothetical protein
VQLRDSAGNPVAANTSGAGAVTVACVRDTRGATVAGEEHFCAPGTPELLSYENGVWHFRIQARSRSLAALCMPVTLVADAALSEQAHPPQ